jgi:hypothetical protein
VPLSNHILPEHKLIYIDNTGVVTAADVAKNYHKAVQLPGASLVRHVLVDLRHLKELRAYFDGMAAVADMIAYDGEDSPEPWDTALVSNNTGHYPLLLEYAATMRRSGVMRCEVLRSIEDAVSWLGLSENAIKAIDALNETGSPPEGQSIDGTT